MTIRGTHDEVALELSKALAGVEPSLQAACNAAVLAVLTSEQQPKQARRLDASLDEKDTFYVVHEADLSFLKDGVTVALALIPLFKPLAAVPTLVGLLFRYRRKRARLDAEQAAVLMCLRDAPLGGLTAAQIVKQLPLVDALTQERVLEVLGGLRQVLLADGSRSDFVAEAAGYWTASDI
jgi:hypothetical protein